MAGDGSGGRVLVLGGYGAVGAVAARSLARRLPGRVVVAGRDIGRARRLAEDSGGTLLAARVDLGDPVSLARALDGVSLVVLCVEPPDGAPHPARLLFERGVGLVDVTASRELVAEVEAHGALARARGARAVLSVGVAPGLTNLLARQVHADLGGADRVDLSVVLGAGEPHGKDAVRWTVGRLGQREAGRGPGQRAAGGGGPLRVTTGPSGAARTHHPFPFSDQYTLRRTLGVPEVTTRLALDSGPLTGLLFGLRAAGAFRAARAVGAEPALTALFGAVHVGGADFTVRADAHRGGRHAARAVTGRAQSRFTGLVAAWAAARAHAGRVPAGVRHIEELADAPDLLGELRAEGLRAWRITR
ncbi:hypothetical protein GCM10018785_66890 [Streptomyces longispororuber]|uniref:Saccharopine dehydrogenase NADP binding domain-containing protein n=1 Tax=Streptomyces longispororuber TaxID=68230 RepID=A0A919A6Z5_9ACTN|nr:saccharopine dehydrogenase NADP-binding domain-containing protein [Streptomyces longispororuber]GHE90783.1 hypothetical protein GCM10018785_66890 [Streptomyces longispororuber]